MFAFEVYHFAKHKTIVPGDGPKAAIVVHDTVAVQALEATAFLTKLYRMPNQTSAADSRPQQILPELPFQLTFDSVDSWLKRIPSRNTRESCKLVYSALRRFNRYRIDPVQRIGILERFRPYVFGLSDDLEPLFIDATFPLDSNIRKISKLSSQFHAELAAGYLFVFDHGDFDKITIPEQEKALVLVRTLQSTYWCLIRIAQLYEAPATRFWKRLYAVFRYAEHHDLLYLEVRDRNRQTACSVEGLLKQIMLLWLANPYRHRQHQIKQIASLLNKFAELAQFRNHRPDNADQSLFFIDLASNAPPRHVSHFAHREGRACRFLDARPLVDEVIKFVADPFSERRRIDPAPDRELVSRFIRTLGGVEERKHPRKSENLDVQFIVGLANIMDAIAGPGNLGHAFDPGDSRLSWDVPNYELLPTDGGNARPLVQFTARSEGDRNQVTSEEIWGDKAAVNEDPLHSSFGSTGRMMNSSMKGYLFMTPDNSSIKVKIAELIAIRQADQPLHLGVVRWLESTEGQGMEFGIELLSRTAAFASAKFSVNTFLTERVLVLDKMPELNIPNSVVLSHAKYRSGTRVELVVDGKTKHFRLQKLIELSPGFVRYTVSVPQS